MGSPFRALVRLTLRGLVFDSGWVCNPVSGLLSVWLLARVLARVRGLLLAEGGLRVTLGHVGLPLDPVPCGGGGADI